MKDYRERNGMYYRRHFVYRSQEELDMYEEDMMSLVSAMKSKKTKQDFYRNTDQCYNYNSECPFFKICHTQQPDELTTKLYFERRESCQNK